MAFQLSNLNWFKIARFFSKGLSPVSLYYVVFFCLRYFWDPPPIQRELPSILPIYPGGLTEPPPPNADPESYWKTKCFQQRSMTVTGPPWPSAGQSCCPRLLKKDASSWVKKKTSVSHGLLLMVETISFLWFHMIFKCLPAKPAKLETFGEIFRNLVGTKV